MDASTSQRHPIPFDIMDWIIGHEQGFASDCTGGNGRIAFGDVGLFNNL